MDAHHELARRRHRLMASGLSLHGAGLRLCAVRYAARIILAGIKGRHSMTNKHISLAPVHEVRAEVIFLWGLGLDTKDISSRVNRPESWVYNTLSKWRQTVKIELT